MQTELIEWLDDDVHWPLEVPRLHRIHLLAAEPAVARTESDADDAQLDVPTEFFWRVDQAQPLGKSAWNDLGGDSSVERERFAQIQAASGEETQPSSSVSLVAAVGNGFEGQACSSTL